MRKFIAPLLLAAATGSLAACGGNGSGELADKVEAAAENRSDQLKAEAENLIDQAERTEKVGEQRADAIEAANLNANAIPADVQSDIIANEAAAVR